MNISLVFNQFGIIGEGIGLDTWHCVWDSKSFVAASLMVYFGGFVLFRVVIGDIYSILLD